MHNVCYKARLFLNIIQPIDIEIVFMSGKTNHKKESATISVHQTDHISRYACNRLFQCCDHALGTADRQREKGNEIGFESRSCVIALLTTVWWVKQPSWVEFWLCLRMRLFTLSTLLLCLFSWSQLVFIFYITKIVQKCL